MTNKKSAKRALLMSALALLLCVSMLVGSTFAWFTDSVTSGNNIIKSGNLDMKLSYKPYGAEHTEWNEVTESTVLFGEDALYEPGYTEAVWLKVENLGSLAFRYDLAVNVASEKPGKTKDGEDINLSDYLEVKYMTTTSTDMESGFYTTRESLDNFAWGLAANSGVASLNDDIAVIKNGVAYSADDAVNGAYSSAYVLVVISMPTTVGNEANHNGTDIPEINFTLTALATQVPNEKDSFGSDYDADAEYPELADKWDGTVDTSWYNDTDTAFEIYTAAELAGFSQLAFDGNNFAGKTVRLMSNIDLAGQTWVPVKSFGGEFDGNNKTISNLVIDATASNAGFFNVIEAGDGERVHDLTISGVDATVGAYRFGTLANSIKGIVNRVTINDVNATTTASTAWVGGMCAFMDWPWLNDCTVKNMVVDATNGAEFVAGFSPILQKNSNMVFTNCDVNGFKVTVTDTDGSCGVGGFAGQTQRGWENPSLLDCDVTGIDIVATGTVDIGGFMAWPGGHTIAKNCTTEGKIDASGVTGKNNFVGGFFGNLGWNADLGQMGHVITDCTANVEIISGGAPAGGFVGSATNSNNGSMYATFNHCTANGNVTNANGAAGGFAGDADRGDYNNCTATGTVTGAIAGGFIGQIKDVTPTYDYRYPAGTRDYLVDEIFIDGCTASAALAFIGQIDNGTNVTIDGVKQ